MYNDIAIKTLLENKIKILIFFILTLSSATFYYFNFNTLKYQNNINLYSSINNKEKNIENFLVNLNHKILNGNANLQDLIYEFKKNYLKYECSNIKKIYHANFIDFILLPCPKESILISDLVSYQKPNKELFNVNISNKDVIADVRREFDFFKIKFKKIKNLNLSFEEVKNKSFVNITMVIDSDKKLSLDDSKILAQPLVEKLRDLFKKGLINLLSDVEIDLNREIKNINSLINSLDEELSLLRENLFKNALADLNIYYESKKFSDDFNNFWLNKVETNQKPSVFIENTIKNIIALEKKNFKNNPALQDIKNYKKNIIKKNYNKIFKELKDEITKNEKYLIFENIGISSNKIFNTLPIILLTFIFFANLFFFSFLVLINFIRNK